MPRKSFPAKVSNAPGLRSFAWTKKSKGKLTRFFGKGNDPRAQAYPLCPGGCRCVCRCGRDVCLAPAALERLSSIRLSQPATDSDARFSTGGSSEKRDRD